VTACCRYSGTERGKGSAEVCDVPSKQLGFAASSSAFQLDQLDPSSRLRQFGPEVVEVDQDLVWQDRDGRGPAALQGVRGAQGEPGGEQITSRETPARPSACLLADGTRELAGGQPSADRSPVETGGLGGR
jgi:hypothetical protein